MLPFFPVLVQFVLEVLVEHFHGVVIVAHTPLQELRHNYRLLLQGEAPFLFEELATELDHRFAGQLLAPENDWIRFVSETGHLEGSFKFLGRLFIFAAIDAVFLELDCHLTHHALDPLPLLSFFERAAPLSFKLKVIQRKLSIVEAVQPDLLTIYFVL